MKQISLTLTGKHAEDFPLDLKNFTNSKIYRVNKVSKNINVRNHKYVTIDIDEEIVNPNGDIIIIYSGFDTETNKLLVYAIWQSKVWEIVNNYIMKLLNLVAK